METVLQSIPGILVALATVIPLCVKLVKSVQSLVREKRWSKLMQLVVDLMATAENKLADGADRKEWVLAMVKASADELGCEFDEKVVGEMIDSIAAMAKVVNSPTPQDELAASNEVVA